MAGAGDNNAHSTHACSEQGDPPVYSVVRGGTCAEANRRSECEAVLRREVADVGNPGGDRFVASSWGTGTRTLWQVASVAVDLGTLRGQLDRRWAVVRDLHLTPQSGAAHERRSQRRSRDRAEGSGSISRVTGGRGSGRSAGGMVGNARDCRGHRRETSEAECAVQSDVLCQ